MNSRGRRSRSTDPDQSHNMHSAGQSNVSGYGTPRQSLSSRAPSTVIPSSPQSEGGANDNKRACKERGPNWTTTEVLIMIQAPRDLHLDELDCTDPRDLMLTDSQKWASVSHDIMLSGYFETFRDPTACKAKWHQLLPEYKKIADHCACTGMNIPEYWDMFVQVRKINNLPRQFSQEFFYAMHEWLGNRPQIKSPHIRDLLSPMDGNFKSAEVETADNDCGTEEQTLAPEEVAGNGATEQSSNPIRPCPRTPLSSPVEPQPTPASEAPTATRTFSAMPNGVVPIVISDFGESTGARKRRPGNIVVRRKNVSGHTVMADATKATREVMASQMQTIADVNMNMERQKMDVQRDLFGQQMAYQRERDQKVQDNAVASNHNTRLSIIKQAEMVTCFSQLTEVLSLGLAASKAGNGHATTGGRPIQTRHAERRGLQSEPSAVPSAEVEGGPAAPNRECPTNTESED